MTSWDDVIAMTTGLAHRLSLGTIMPASSILSSSFPINPWWTRAEWRNDCFRVFSSFKIMACFTTVVRPISLPGVRKMSLYLKRVAPLFFFIFYSCSVLRRACLLESSQIPLYFPGPPPLLGLPTRVPILSSNVLPLPLLPSPLVPFPCLDGLAVQGSCRFSGASTICVLLLSLLYHHVLIILFYAKWGLDISGRYWLVPGPDITWRLDTL